MEELVTVADTFSLPEAHMIKARLEMEGLTCFLRGDLAASCAGVPSRLNLRWGAETAAIEVRVPAPEAAEARSILQQIEENSEPHAAPGRTQRFVQIMAGLYLAAFALIFLTAFITIVGQVLTGR